MKFIHFSDIRIGNNAESGTPWERVRLSELEDGLRRTMQEAAEYAADLVIISGGLFSHVPVTAELEEAATLFADYPGIEIVLIGGETDPVKNSSPVRSFLWPKNVHFFLESRVERLVLRDIRTEIFAASVGEHGTAAPEDFAKALNAAEALPDRQPIKIAVLRADNDEETAAAFSPTDVSYAAVGSNVPESRHLSQRVSCPGFFEPESMGDSGSHGILEGEIPASTGILERVEFVPMAAASYIPLVVRTNTQTTAEEVQVLLTREMTRRGKGNIYRIKLTGSKASDVSFHVDRLRKSFRISEVIDETVPEYDFRTLFAEHPQDMIGFYISKILNSKKEMSSVERMAMYYGLEALLSSEHADEAEDAPAEAPVNTAGVGMPDVDAAGVGASASVGRFESDAPEIDSTGAETPEADDQFESNAAEASGGMNRWDDEDAPETDLLATGDPAHDTDLTYASGEVAEPGAASGAVSASDPSSKLGEMSEPEAADDPVSAPEQPFEPGEVTESEEATAPETASEPEEPAAPKGEKPKFTDPWDEYLASVEGQKLFNR